MDSTPPVRISAVVLPARIASRISIHVSSSIHKLLTASIGRAAFIAASRSAARAARCSGVNSWPRGLCASAFEANRQVESKSIDMVFMRFPRWFLLGLQPQEATRRKAGQDSEYHTETVFAIHTLVLRVGDRYCYAQCDPPTFPPR